MFKKNIFIFLLLTFTTITFATTVPKEELVTKNNIVYVNLDFLKKLDLNYKKDNNKVIINNIIFSKNNISYNNVKVNTLINIIESDYIDINAITTIFNFTFKNNTFLKNNEKNFPITYNNYTITKSLKKIISLSPGVTEKLFKIGAGNMIYGRTSYCNYPKEAKKIEDLGTIFSPNLERIIEIYPDAVISESHFNKKILSKLNEVGIESFAYNYPKNINEIYEFIDYLGIFTNKKYESRIVNYSLKNRVSYYLNSLKNIRSKPTVYYVVGTGEAEYTAGKNTFIDDLIKIAGAKNIADDTEGWVFSKEKLFERNPDIIFGSEYNINLMKNSELYSQLKAFKTGNYFIVDENIMNLSGPRLIEEGLPLLIEHFHKLK
ncbi:iron complex transport system substrate-binding protein [Hypnocyclicus thermotrophus]|uniref:Iron complex transport system substrate-binding protein n=1 Tax=Hypnocyclicus thermotrophus TaxID=1627895 RepID=A0AA46DZZ9_9FUSO|nr:ABC transporter substrate-binding protein [Hypnocyclicus thermotrophus]TDT72226.1 iron complex transport system substrate-binding protein [Hypnocyclicus thermotrophus]